jgi:hypothetical protein
MINFPITHALPRDTSFCKSSFGIESSKSSTLVNEKFSNRVGICHIVCRGINKKITVALLSQVQILPRKTVPPPLDLSREETQVVFDKPFVFVLFRVLLFKFLSFS